MVCAEHTKGTEIILAHWMELLGNLVYVKSHFGPFRDSVYVGAR
jgi:hypothetical protein